MGLHDETFWWERAEAFEAELASTKRVTRVGGQPVDADEVPTRAEAARDEAESRRRGEG